METKTVDPTLRRIAFALAALSATAPSWAVLASEPRGEVVYYGDLNLASDSGVEVLDRRLDRAVARVCGSFSIRNLTADRDVARCREETWDTIRDDRDVAIAKATGRYDGRQELAGSASRGQIRVSLAE
jgi:UrcA family protein